MEEIVQELRLIGIDCEMVKEFIFGNVYRVKFCILQDNDKKIVDLTIMNNVAPIIVTHSSDNYELHNLITNNKVLWKSNYNIRKHLFSCECILCKEKNKIKNDIFYNIAESINL